MCPALLGTLRAACVEADLGNRWKTSGQETPKNPKV